MSQAAAHTFDDFQRHSSAVEFFGLWVLNLKLRVRAWALEFVMVRFLKLYIDKLVQDVRSLDFEKLDDKEAEKACSRLASVCEHLERIEGLAESRGMTRRWLTGKSFRGIFNTTRVLEDILEAWQLSRSDDFRALVERSVAELGN